MKIAVLRHDHDENFPYEFIFTGENTSDGIDIGKTINFFDSEDIKYDFDREFSTLVFKINFDKLEI